MSYPITFGKYLLLERINVGGMAEVFKAKAFGVEGFERILAIKRILPNMAEDDEFINMFIDEARIAVQLGHPNIVPIYELGKFESQYYIAMEYVQGKDLRQVLDRFRKRNETMPISAAAYIVSKVCEGLDYAHRKADPSGRPLNLIHRDVSPQNILVSYEGAVKITDFGIVKAEDRASKTQAGVLKGKFGYMSPEQVRGMEIDRRSDIFAVGILLYEALTGKRLFIGESDFSTLEKVRNAEVVPPSQHNPAVTESIERVVLKALARERDERYQWPMELHDDLQQFLIDEASIFNANKLAHILKEEYQDEIAHEMQKMEEFMRMPTPSSTEALSAAAQMRAAPTGDWSDNRAEKTMIFESGFEGGGAVDAAHTQISPDHLGPPPAPSPSQSLLDMPPLDDRPPRSPQKSSVGRLLITGGLVALMLLSALVYFLMDSSTSVGTLVVTSSPTDQVEIILDNESIGKKTPLIRQDVPVGVHSIVVRAPGYEDKRYHFDLAAAAPAEIKVELDRNSAAMPSGGDTLLELSSDPPGAMVRIGGVPQGTTPYSMPVHDTSRPLNLEFIKAGYSPSQQVITFDPTQKHKAFSIKLTPTTPPDKTLPPGVTPIKLVLNSKPQGATIYLNGEERGVTPKEFVDLDPRAALVVELSRDGFHTQEETLHLTGKGPFTKTIRLVPERGAKKANAPSSERCAGTGGKISLMPVGVSDCRVNVGRISLGVAPVFKKDSPVGRCNIEVKCPGGKHWSSMKVLRPNNEEKIIIKPEDWN